MWARRLEPLVRVVASWFEDSVPREEYETFLRKSVAQLGRAVGASTQRPAWAADLRLALSNFEQTSFALSDQTIAIDEDELAIPLPQPSREWLEKTRERGLVLGGTVERFSAMELLALLAQEDDLVLEEIRPLLDALLRHVEIRRKRSLQLSADQRPSQRWFEVHDSAILLARSARTYMDLRYLNAALKLNDWALPVHRRSVPADLLARYLLAVSEVRLAVEKML